MGSVSLDQAAAAVTAAEAVASLSGASAISCAVKQPLKNVVGEICTLRFDGAGHGQSHPAARYGGRQLPSPAGP